jgi:hypothetical protein
MYVVHSEAGHAAAMWMGQLISVVFCCRRAISIAAQVRILELHLMYTG